MIDSALLQHALSHGFIPLPGRCIIELDEVPSLFGSIHIPDSARDRRLMQSVKGGQVYGDGSCTGTVLAMTPRRGRKEDNYIREEEFKPGDRVALLLLQSDLNQKVISTLNSRIYAVIEPIEPTARTDAPTTDPA